MNRRRVWSIGCLVLVIFLFRGLVFRGQPKVDVTTDKVEAAIEAPTAAPIPTEMNTDFAKVVNECFLPTAAVYGYDLYISSDFRSFKDQDALYQQGRTVNGHIVTNAPAGRSIHNYGLAVDVADHAYGLDIDWDKLEKIGAFCGLEHGDQDYIDLPHFQYIGSLNTDLLEAGQRPLPISTPCQLMSLRYADGDALSLADLQSCNVPDLGKTTASVYQKMKGYSND